MAEEKTSIFTKILEAGEAQLDNIIRKAKANGNSTKNEEDEFYFKSVTEDPSFQINNQGFKEKPTRLHNSHLKQMSLKNSIVSAIIVTRQNQVSNFSRLVKSEKETGFIIKLC